MIELIDLHKKLARRKVLDGLSLKVERGETMVIIGRSGSGKSVTFKHITGLFRPDRGQVLVDGVDVASASRAQLDEVRRRLGVLFQSGALINWLSVAENVALPLRELTNLGEAEIQRIVAEKLDLVELTGAENQMPDSLSGGMRKRAGLARALVRDPEIILYDEPTAGLDPIMANRINELIIDMQRKLKVTSLIVTHDMESAFMVADRIAMLFGGKIIQVGTPQEIQATTNPIVRQFIDGKTQGPVGEQE